MLDAETKRRIDTARDILVGKVPDPKSQVEQITIALIYKFMDDMDALSEELGGERSFFAGEFGRYGWARLMQPGLGGHEMLNLYAEAIERMDQNAGIPQLFRDIFSNAFLPYRDPETLRAFLKVIDGFTYDNSERLGDAFEYLLSVMDSQGDAGQFRTPRHIIDFIVAIVDPHKDDTVLDPACGTGGFLISSYKHILAANTDADGNSTLTPDERARLASNVRGYDISPDMVRLSLVNMYLHGFVAPQIVEYDTLTSEENWNEYADVILANPPFMSPKGGIRPHSRFSMNSKRSEVLFVDYMAEHLNAGGRAGIIVPEGIIFQSQNAHKQLRKKLVEDCLVAVVSLPAGVFNPYSGVKTSILLLDKALARKTDHIAFFKVENDGYNLGAQRRPIEQNDLPQVGGEIAAYMQRLWAGEAVAGYRRETWQIIGKERIAADADYVLNGERYKGKSLRMTEFPTAEIGKIVEFFSDGDWVESKDQSESGIRLIQTGNIGLGEYLDKKKNSRFISEETLERLNCTEVLPGDVLISRLPDPVGRACIAPDRGARQITAVDCSIVRFDRTRMIPELFVAYTKAKQYYRNIEAYLTGTTRPRISRKNLAKVQIPLPPLDVQQEIVAEIEGYQKVIDGARAVVENYRPHIHVDPDWPVLSLGDCCKVKGGKRLPRGTQYENEPTDHPYIRVADFRERSVDVRSVRFISDSVQQAISRYTISSSDVYISIAGTIGLMGTIPVQLNGANLTENAAKLVIDRQRLDKRFLSIIGNGEVVQEQVRSLTHAVGVPKLALQRIEMIRIPLPPLDVQREIAAEIEAEQALVDANRELIEGFEKKIQDAIARVWADES